jgi:hypothetical protein
VTAMLFDALTVPTHSRRGRQTPRLMTELGAVEPIARRCELMAHRVPFLVANLGPDVDPFILASRGRSRRGIEPSLRRAPRRLLHGDGWLA